MFNDLTGLGYGLIVFAIIIGVGTVILYNFGGATGCSSPRYWNTTDNKCYNSTYADPQTPTGTTYTSVTYLGGQLGSAGLAGWTPAIIAISVGLLFLGAFMLKGSKKGKYG